MDTQRLSEIYLTAQAARSRLARWGSIRRNLLPLVSPAEHDLLCRQYPDVAGFVRTFQYADSEFIESTDIPVQSRPPHVTEIWVGARSMDCVPDEDSRDHEEQLRIEDQVELTDLQTLLYNNIEGPMIEDPETGNLRPVVEGDVVEVVTSGHVITRHRWPEGELVHVDGLTDSLDALFMDEPEDPRVQNDRGAYGTDHKWSDRFAANSPLEEKFLTGFDSVMIRPRRWFTFCPEGMTWAQAKALPPCQRTVDEDAVYLRLKGRVRSPDGVEFADWGYKLPNTAFEGSWNPDDMQLAALAESRANVRCRAAGVTPTPEIVQAFEGDLRTETLPILFDEEGTLIQGHFVSRDEFFATQEENRRAFDAAVKVRKAAPKPVEWAKIRRAPVQKRRVERPSGPKYVHLTYSEIEMHAIHHGLAWPVAWRPKSAVRSS